MENIKNLLEKCKLLGNSYYEKHKLIKKLSHEKESLAYQVSVVEKKNSLLTDIIDIDYLETLYRTKFMVGKKNEKIYLK